MSGPPIENDYEQNVFTITSRFGTTKHYSRSEAKEEIRSLLDKIPFCFQREFMLEVHVFDEVL